MTDQTSPQSTLRALIDALHAEWVLLQIIGRALTPEEQQRSAVLGQTLEHLRAALTALESSPPVAEPGPAPTPPAATLRDGRYQGGNGTLAITLRLDEAVSGVISADLFRIDPGGETWVASIRTDVGMRVVLADRMWTIVAEDADARVTSGELSLVGQSTDPLTIVATLRLDSPLAGIPGQTDVTLTATWRTETLRELGLEVEREQGLAELPEYHMEGRTVTVQSCLAQAGFDTFEVGQRSTIPARSESGWGTTELHALMVQHAQAVLSREAWELHLLLLGRPTRSGLLGVMFDTSAQLPRQGSAVFATEIQDFAQNFERKLIQTTVHELGHALNLAHRFERELNHADSTSFMNYDWRYRGGGRSHEFWSRFDFSFDPDELAFLRHAPLRAVVPGGHPFHSVAYWTEGSGGYVPYYPEVVISDMELVLRGPQSGLVFDYLQPIFLEVEIFNRTGETLDLPRWWLDPKSGALDIVVRRVNNGTPGEPALWVPMMQRCREFIVELADTVPNGQSLKRNLNLTFGASGFSFAEPGEYDIQAVVSLPIEAQRREYIIPSNTLRIRVSHPHSRSEEQDAMVLQRPDVGTYLALGGSRVLQQAAEDLEEVRKRRQGRSTHIKDPVVAAIVRCQAIDAGRPYTLREHGKFVTHDGDFAQAAALLGSLDDQALRTFDAETAQTTQALAKKHQKNAKAKGARKQRRK